MAGLALPSAMPTSAWAAPRRKPDSLTFPKVPEGDDMLPQIEHIVVVMMENHSYDNYLGVLDRGDGFRARPRRPADEREPRRQRQPGPRVPHAVDLPARPRARARTGTRATSSLGNDGRNDGFVRGERSGRDGLLDRERHPLLLRARAHVPALRPLVLLGARADVSRTAASSWPAPRSGIVSTDVCQVAHRAAAAERHDLRPPRRARHLVAELLHRPALSAADPRQARRTTATSVVADRPVLRRRRRGHAARRLARRPELRQRRVGGEPARHPQRRDRSRRGSSTR